MTDKPTHRAYQLRLRDDGMAELRLTEFHQVMLVYLAEVGGETNIDYAGADAQRVNRKEGSLSTREGFLPMMEMGLIIETAIVGTNRHNLRLTTMGRNVAAKILEGKKKL